LLHGVKLPNVGEYDNEKDWMQACVPKMIQEGKEQDQAVAACMNMWKQKGKAAESNISHLFGNAFREVKQGEKDYLVVPGVPVREQVMNDYWVPAQEIQHSLNGWNGTPISISHPTLNNGSVNVPAPDVAIIGRFYNAKWDEPTKRMIGEYWIDLGEAGRYQEGQTIIDNIRANKVLETSTGYWADDEQSTGTFGGKDY